MKTTPRALPVLLLLLLLVAASGPLCAQGFRFSQPDDRAERDAAAREEGELPELRGIIVSGNLSMAIFRSHRPDGGNRLVPVGGKVGVWTLSRVEPYHVSLRRGKETRVLELYKQ